MLITLMLGFSIFLTIEILSMKRILKHDKYIFQLQALNDEAVSYLCTHYMELSKKE